MSTTVQTAVIIVGDFHTDIAEHMVTAAQTELKSAGVPSVETITVAGSYELPLVADMVLENKKPDIVVALGYIEKGETLHGEVMGHVVYKKLLDLQLNYRTPIGLGLIGPGATRQQADARVTATATGAAQAALRTYATLQELLD
jgi:6,7-dimethyl-8-ribityllumazine synthase